MSAPKLCYVVGAWFGGRRIMDECYRHDRLAFVREHLRRLRELKHSWISRVVIAYPAHLDTELPPTGGLDALVCEEIRRGAPYTIELFPRKNNIGMAWGSWVDVMLKHREQYDGYFLLEDDYAYALDHFDRIVWDYSNWEKARFVTGWGYKTHAGFRLAVPSGFIRKKAVLPVCGYMSKRFAPEFWRPTYEAGGVYADRHVTYWSWAFSLTCQRAVHFNNQYACRCRFPGGRWVVHGKGNPVLFESIT